MSQDMIKITHEECCTNSTEKPLLMREAKYRGKAISNGEWVYGVPFAEYIICGMTTAYYDSDVPMSAHVGFDYIEVDPATVGQFTGLYDKCKDEIYEGDAMQVRPEWGKAMCVFYDKRFGAYMLGAFGNAMYYLHKIHKNNKVIGNKHDNPELVFEGV